MQNNSSNSTQDYSSVILEVKRAYQEWVEKNEELEKDITQVQRYKIYQKQKDAELESMRNINNNLKRHLADQTKQYVFYTKFIYYNQDDDRKKSAEILKKLESAIAERQEEIKNVPISVSIHNSQEEEELHLCELEKELQQEYQNRFV